LHGLNVYETVALPCNHGLGAIDILQQRVDRELPPCRMRARPPIGAEACAHVALGVFLEAVKRPIRVSSFLDSAAARVTLPYE
jgi:hypothetical protein